MTRRKDGIWQEVLTINGRKRYFYGKTKTAVLKKTQEFKEEQERGVLFEPVADEWWEVHEPQIAYTTARGYEPAMRRAIATFGSVPIKEIMPQQIATEISAFAHNRADKTVRTQLMVYNLIFRYAVEKGYILF